MADRKKHQAQTMLNFLTWHPEMIEEYDDEELGLVQQLLNVQPTSDRKANISTLKAAIAKYKTTPKRAAPEPKTPTKQPTKQPSKQPQKVEVDDDEVEIIEPQVKRFKPQPKVESEDSVIELISTPAIKPETMKDEAEDEAEEELPALEYGTEPVDSMPPLEIDESIVAEEVKEPVQPPKVEPEVKGLCDHTVQFAADAINLRPQYNPEINGEYLSHDIRIIERMMKGLPHCSTIVNTLGNKFQTTQAVLLDTLKHINSRDVNMNDLNYKYIQCFVRDLLSCNYDSAYYNAEMIQVISKQLQPYIRLDKIKTSSQHAIVWKAFVKQMTTPFAVLKMQRYKGAASIIHELAIGLILNQLRDTIPYFAYTYGGFYCNKTGKDDQLGCKQVDNASISAEGTLKELVALSFQEYVDHEYSASEFLLNLLLKKNVDVLSKAIDEVLLQVAYALYKAQQAYQFIHNDLHSGNVLMKQVNPRSNVVLKLDNRLSIDFAKVTGSNIVLSLPILIDFGDSSVVVIEGQQQTRLCNPKVADDSIKDNVPKWPIVPTGLDIFRFSTSLLIKLMDEAEGAAMKRMLETKYNKCIALFKLHADQVQTPGMKDVIETYNLSSLSKLMNASNEELARQSVVKKVNMKKVVYAIRWSKLQDIGLFDVSMYDWINHYING